ncbi:MAG TPA: CHAT domain-containing protein [Anaerolineales bacterium]|nr:CHAT domain-containing protein [Anaerolineales bacterium]
MPVKTGRYRAIVALEQEAMRASEAGQFSAARQAHSRALLIAKDLARPRLRAVLYYRLGDDFEVDGDLQQAVRAHEQGFTALAEDAAWDEALIRDILREFGQVGKEFRWSNILAMPIPGLYSPVAAADLKQAEADPLLAVKLLVKIGNVYLLMPQEKPALSRYEQALRMPEIEASPDLRAHVLMHIGFIQRRLGQTDYAEEVLLQALDVLEKHLPEVSQRRVLAVLAGIQNDRGLIQQAVEMYTKALSLYEKVDDALGHGRTLGAMAAVYLEQGDYVRAEPCFRRALELAEKVGDSDSRWQAYWGLGCCAQAGKDLSAAEIAFRRSLDIAGLRQVALRTDEGRVAFLDGVQDIYDRLISVCLEAGKWEAAWRVAEAARGQVIGDLLAARRENRHPAPGVFESWQQPLQDGSQMMMQMAPGMPLVDDYILRESLPMGKPQPAVALQPLNRLVFHSLAQETAIFVVSPDGSVFGHICHVGRVELAARIHELRQTLQVDAYPRGVKVGREGCATGSQCVEFSPDDWDDPRSLLENFYAEFIRPVEQVLPPEGELLVIEPHGPLWLLPFAALCREDGAWLGERWPIVFAPSAEVMDGIRQETDYGTPADLRALVIGNPAMPQQDLGTAGFEFEALPGAELEAKTVAAMFASGRSELLLGAQATRQAVEQRMPAFGILHLASHGLVDGENPNESYVVLGETEGESGLLKAGEVARMHLPADLVCLSACQTGLGRISGDGVLGLSRAFLAAGARAVLVSLWSVDDRATAELIRVFYQVYLSEDDKALALQQAMRALRAQPEYEHPRYWAPFILVGSEA